LKISTTYAEIGVEPKPNISNDTEEFSKTEGKKIHEVKNLYSLSCLKTGQNHHAAIICNNTNLLVDVKS
jgi:hypothetical protein